MTYSKSEIYLTYEQDEPQHIKISRRLPNMRLRLVLSGYFG